MCTGVGDGGGELDKFDIPRKQVVAPARAVFAVVLEEFVALEEDFPLYDESTDAISMLDICLHETLQALPDDERWLIEESDLNRRPQQSLADELGISLTAFKSRLLRARKHLKETMTELCQIEADDTSPVCCHKKMN